MSSIASTLLSAAEEAALADVMAGPLVGVHVRIAVKFRAMQHDLGAVTIIDHSFQWPVPAVFAAANPHPVALNTHGIQLDVTLSQPAASAFVAAPDASTAGTDTNITDSDFGPTPLTGGDVLASPS